MLVQLLNKIDVKANGSSLGLQPGLDLGYEPHACFEDLRPTFPFVDFSHQERLRVGLDVVIVVPFVFFIRR